MPFPAQQPRAFNRPNVEAINPGQAGCYGLFREGRWVYVGKGDIRARLLAHLGGDNSCITRGRPTHWVDWVIPIKKEMDSTEKALIAELNTECNEKLG